MAQSRLIRAMVAATSVTPNRSAISLARRFSGSKVQQIQHKGTDPRAVLHRRGDPARESRARLCAAGGAAAAMRAVLGDDQWFRFRQIEHLSGDVIDRHRHAQSLAAPGAGSRIVVDRGIRGFRPA